MTYRVDIKFSSKAKVRLYTFRLRPVLLGVIASLVAIFVGSGFYIKPDKAIALDNREPVKLITELNQPRAISKQNDLDVTIVELGALENQPPVVSLKETVYQEHPKNITHAESELDVVTTLEAGKPELNTVQIISANKTEVSYPASHSADNNTISTSTELENGNIHWKKVEIKRGENLSILFDRLSISPRDLHNIMSLGDKTATLKRVMPGQFINFGFKQGNFIGLEFEKNLTDTLVIKRDGKSFSSETQVKDLEKRTRYATAVIDSSLFLAGQRVGITDKVIMNMVSIYGWDIDFALNIRSGDNFSILYEEHYKDGVKVNDGPILAAEFSNQGKIYRAVRYTHKDGKSDYYSDTGHNMRKAFIRTPVNFSRISSHFNLRRKHPVLNTIRAHKGVDYAAKTGTPIMAAGDGTIIHKGTKGGYGRTVIIKHGSQYTTLYAHMSRYAKGMSHGKRVKQGQTIGYVGSSGLATGPHLHYEFRVNGAHRNPLKVEFPKALRIPDEIMADFKQQTLPLLAQLDEEKQTAIASLNHQESQSSEAILAMSREDRSTVEMTH